MAPPKPSRNTGWIGWLPLVVLPLAALALYNLLQPWAFMWILAVSIYCGLKWLTWSKARGHVPHAAWRSIAYLVAWPGMDADSFLDARKVAPPPRFSDWTRAVLETSLGATLLWVVAPTVPQTPAPRRGGGGM